jgi:ribonuclease BN (tRNA processing enzyme)
MERNMKKVSSMLFRTLIGMSIVGLVHESMAQTSPAPSKTTRLITLGTLGGPNPKAHQAQSSNLLIVNGTLYIVDAGDGVARRLAKAGVDIRGIGTIFLTHLHDDHTAGLGTLMSVAWDQNRTKPINVYGPPRTVELVKAAVQYFAISAEIRIADGGRTVPIAQMFVGHDVGTGMVYQDANIKVTSVENSHFDFHKSPAAGKHKSYAYRFETPDRVIVFTGDTGPSDAVTELAKGADLLVTETSSFQDRMQMMIKSGQWQAMTPEEQAGIKRQATQGHMTTDVIGKMATRAKVKTVVLTHLTYNPDGDYTPRADEVKKNFSGQVLIAKDLMEF